MLNSEFALFLVSIILAAFSISGFRIENDFICLEFNSLTGELVSIIDKISSIDIVGSAAGAVPILSFVIVGEEGYLEIEDFTDTEVQGNVTRNDLTRTNELTLTWPSVKITKESIAITSADISLHVSLFDQSTVAEWSYSFTIVKEFSAHSIGIWEVIISLPLCIGGKDTGELFYPAGFGYLFTNPILSTGGHYKKNYPGGQATMQFMAVGDSQLTTGAYLAALDPTGQAKGLQFVSQLSSGTIASKSPMQRNHNELESAKPFLWKEGSEGSAVALSIVVYPPGSGIALTAGIPFTAPYSIAVGIIPTVNAKEGTPLWSEAGNLYRQWALSQADWTRNGPISDPRRSAEFPAWYLENNVWLNTHWQCHDIFNVTGGDPDFVLDNTISIADRLGEDSLALHWYEWQQGPDPAPEARYLFDTHYPDYFPARSKFDVVIEALAKRNISTFPYINGRIADIHSDSYLKDDGDQYCTKESTARVIDRTHPPDLTSYVETYGSNATFCVTNPFTDYWQDKLASTVAELVQEDNVAGVYIDQIGSAYPRLCWDVSHRHTLGGGQYWVSGYQQMMDTIQQRIATSSKRRPMVTEDNAEPFISMAQGFLTLNAFKARYDATISSGAVVVAPAFPLVYGGYYVGFGTIWTRADFEDSDWWCSKLSIMLTMGSQLGWFSLIGVNDDPADSCGPMGVGDLFMDPVNDELVEFFQAISLTRKLFNKYFVHGRIIRPPVLAPNPATGIYTSSFDSSQQRYSTVQLQAWTLDSSGSGSRHFLVAMIGSSTMEYRGELTINMDLWMTNGNTVRAISLKRWSLNESTGEAELLKFEQSEDAKRIITLPVTVPPRSPLMIELTPIF